MLISIIYLWCGPELSHTYSRFEIHLSSRPAWLNALPSDGPGFTQLLLASVSLSTCMCPCLCVCSCSDMLASPLALPFAPMFIPLSDPFTPSPSCLLSRHRSLPLACPFRPRLILSRNRSLPLSPSTACGVNCHKSCRGRLAVECRKRTKSISHETPPALQARSYSFPPPANSPSSLQDTGEAYME